MYLVRIAIALTVVVTGLDMPLNEVDIGHLRLGSQVTNSFHLDGLATVARVVNKVSIWGMTRLVRLYMCSVVI